METYDMREGMFRRRVLFNVEQITRVPRESGIYIIYSRLTERPVYVGRSRQDIRHRLQCHLIGRGSRKITDAMANDIPLDFEYECLMSVEQAESQLIGMLGTREFFNLRSESDPADWDEG